MGFFVVLAMTLCILAPPVSAALKIGWKVIITGGRKGVNLVNDKDVRENQNVLFFITRSNLPEMATQIRLAYECAKRAYRNLNLSVYRNRCQKQIIDDIHEAL